MGQIVSDTFVRANGALGANWTNLGTGNEVLEIVSNRCMPNAAAVLGEMMAYYSGAGWTGGADQYAEAALGLLESGRDLAIACRISGTTVANANAYFIDINSTDAAIALPNTIQCSFYKQVAGGFAQLGSDFGVPLATNDVIRLDVQGTTLRFLVNGVQKGTITDSDLSTGKPGLYVGSGTGSAWGNGSTTGFAAGDFTAAAAAVVDGPRGDRRPFPFTPGSAPQRM